MHEFWDLEAKATKDRFHVLDLAALADNLFVDVVRDLLPFVPAAPDPAALVRHVWPKQSG